MEELLNKLIEKGWKPSGKECSHFIMQHNADVLNWKVIYTAIRKDEGVYNIHYTYRELVSKESGLWQFVCDKCLVKPEVDIISICSYVHYTDDHEDFGYVETEPEFWIISSSLCNEEDLEKFLLDNIKIS